MKELKIEAENYANKFRFIAETDSWFNNKYKTFIAGATSSYVEKEKIKFAIEELMWTNLLVNTDDPAKEILNSKIKELKQKLKEYGY